MIFFSLGRTLIKQILSLFIFIGRRRGRPRKGEEKNVQRDAVPKEPERLPIPDKGQVSSNFILNINMRKYLIGNFCKIVN